MALTETYDVIMMSYNVINNLQNCLFLVHCLKKVRPSLLIFAHIKMVALIKLAQHLMRGVA